MEKASYQKIQGRPGERNDEYLIGELELPYTRVQNYNGIEHYVINFNEKADIPRCEPRKADRRGRVVSGSHALFLKSARWRRAIEVAGPRSFGNEDSGRRAARAKQPGAVGKEQKWQGSHFCKFFDPRQSTFSNHCHLQMLNV
jgi:hypothetical protein